MAGDPIDALALRKEFQPRLILLDIQLPWMDGLSLTRLLKANPSMRDIILGLTACAMKGDEERILAAGSERVDDDG